MKKMVSSSLALVAALGAALGVQAQQEVSLRVEDPVAKAGTSGTVEFTATNHTSSTVYMSSPSPWYIEKGGQLVYSPISIMILGKLNPGESKTWAWDKKKMGGEYVPAGNYTVVVGQFFKGDSSYALKCDFALTSSGRLAGTSPFPLSTSNAWTYLSGPVQGNPAGSSTTMKVTSYSPSTGWYKVKDTPHGTLKLKLTGVYKRTLWVLVDPPNSGPVARPMFRFDRSVGYTWDSKFIGKLKVTATNETVKTPAGTFEKCYRVDVVESPIADAGYNTYWFAKGVGLVQYKKGWWGGSNTHSLHHAKVKGSDGKVYKVGQH